MYLYCGMVDSPNTQISQQTGQGIVLPFIVTMADKQETQQTNREGVTSGAVVEEWLVLGASYRM